MAPCVAYVTDKAQKFSVAAPGYVLEEAAWQDRRWSGQDHMIRSGDVAVQVFRKAKP